MTFLFFFLPPALLGYHLAPRRFRNLLLLAASLLFYAWGAGAFVLGLLASITVNYIVGHQVERLAEREQTAAARRVLAFGVAFNLLVLAIFKYANFGVETWNGLLAAANSPPLPWAPILLPIGISFFTFHAISYLVDIYRGTARHLVSPIDFGLYIAFFPQLIAGPIVRFHEIREQLVSRRETVDAASAGLYRFALGLAKKVLVADLVAPIANAVFATPTDGLWAGVSVLGVVAYTVQLYFDFSGYSDMALGLALMFGIRLPENFNRPYASRSITEFWRRWHMSLSRWFRDYLYIPLGGNRGTRAATYRNLTIVFLATGLWHGANWTFVVWGAYHGILLALERARGVGRDAAIRGRAWQASTVLLVVCGWVLFRSPTIEYALGWFASLGRLTGALPVAVVLASDPIALGALAFGVASVLLPGSWVTGVRIEQPVTVAIRVLRLVMAVVLLPAAIVLVLAGTFSPFLYFQF